MDDAWQIEIIDETSLRGDSVASALERIAETASADVLMIRDIEASGLALQRLQALTGRAKPVPLSEVLNVLRGISHVDWGDFAFVSRGHVPASPEFQDLSFEDLIRCSTVLVRAVDSNYLYIYGQGQVVLGNLRRAFPEATYKTGSIDALDFPE
jgi:hypothetical protein